LSPLCRAMARLHLNESPYPPSPLVAEELARSAYTLNRYRDEDLERALLREIARYVDVPREFVSVYPSSSAALIAIMKMCRFEGLRFVTTHPGFHALREFARLEGIEIERIPLKLPNFELDLDEVLRRVDDRTVLMIANPNNPTSNVLIDREEVVERLAERVRILVLDEAYAEFWGKSFVSLTKRVPNLVIVRTFSKAFALAGARIGYIVAQPQTLKKIDSYRVPFDLPTPSIAAALAALQDRRHAQMIVRNVVHLRERMARELRSMGLRVLPSATNFLFVDVGRRCSEVAEELRKRNILVACFEEPPIETFIRVSVGREEECFEFIKALREVLARG